MRPVELKPTTILVLVSTPGLWGFYVCCHKRGHKVLVYTVNTQKDIDRLAKIGVDGVFSNFPELKTS